MIRVFKTVDEWMLFRRSVRGSLGFVPTMGALHDGHGALIQRSAAESEATLVSIFVNPTQFNDPRDLEKYPRTLEADVALAERSGADYLLAPERPDLYPDGYRFRVVETEFSKTLCGAHRPGHFEGVLTVVMKLLQIANAHRAYFGEKDFQQLELIRGMARAFFLSTEIVGCPTVRDFDGLALSSRNTRLSPEDRHRATLFPRLLSSDRSPAEIRSALESEGFRVDYVEDHGHHRLGAVHLGSVRLIDHVEK